MTTTRRYSSADAGAPPLNGTLGSLITLLKTCLVGSGGIAYGSTPAAGWTTEFEDAGAYKIVLRNSLAAGGTGCYIRILDDGTGTSATAQHAHINAYSSMSDIDTGTDATPAPVAGWPGGRIEKSNAANGTNYGYEIVADELTCYLCTYPSSNTNAVLYGFGDFSSRVLPDNYRVFVAAGRASTAAASRGSALTEPAQLSDASGSVAIMRSQTGASGAVTAGVYAYPVSNSYGGSSSPFTYSANYGNETQLAEALISSSGGIRGSLRGLFLPMQRTHGETLPQVVAGTEVGSSLLMLRSTTSLGTSNQSYWGAALIETANAWPL